MAYLRNEVMLNVANVSATGSWHQLDRTDTQGGLLRSFTGKLAAGDTVFMEVTNQPVFTKQGIAVSVSVVTTVSAFTDASFGAVFNGPFCAVRFRKTGTAGSAVVYGII